MGAGHSLGEIRREWTPALIVRMADAAARRRRHEWVMLAHIIAAGVNAGMSGDFKPLRALSETLGVSQAAGGLRARGLEMGDVVTRLYARVGARYAGGRSDSR